MTRQEGRKEDLLVTLRCRDLISRSGGDVRVERRERGKMGCAVGLKKWE